MLAPQRRGCYPAPRPAGDLMEIATHMLRTGRRGARFEFSMALDDLRRSIDRLSLAWALARHDLVSRYRGSILGPFWITLSMGLMILGIGFLYANLFRAEVKDFIPFVALGIVVFTTVSTTINEGSDTFVQAAGMLSQTSLPMFTFVWRTVLRNLLNFAHHLVIVVAVLIYFGVWRESRPLEALAGLLLVLLNASWLSMLVGIGSARFRDIPQIVGSIMQFAMFMTPVFWTPDRFPERHAVLFLNPFNHMLSVVRAPMLGKPVDPASWAVLIVIAVAGWAVTFTLFSFTRRRIVHFL
jgi:ABC-type polysaccharide/polyol phosphate export permease